MTDIWVRNWFKERLIDELLAIGVPFDRIAEHGTVFDDTNPVPISSSITMPLEQECYFVPYYIVADPWAKAIGLDAPNKYKGAYQVTVYSPLGVDDLQIINMLTPVASAFKKGVSFSEEGYCIYCEQAYIASSTRDKDKWQVVLRIKFTAIVEN